MEAETLAALRSRLVCLPGGRTRQHHPIILVTVPAQLQPWTKRHLQLAVDYILNILETNFGKSGFVLMAQLNSDLIFTIKLMSRDESKTEGLAVLVDSQRGSWRLARALIRQLRQILISQLSTMIVLRSDAFWAKQRVDHCTKHDKDKEPMYISKSRLSKYVDDNNLPVDLGGQYEYNHTQWIQTRLLVDEFCRRSKEALSQLQAVRTQLFQCRDTRLCHLSAALAQNAHMSEQAEILAQDVQRAGESLLQQYQSPIVISPVCHAGQAIADAPVRVREPQDWLDTQTRIQRALEAISTARLQAEEAWLSAERIYTEAQQVEQLAKSLDQVTAWILGPGESLLTATQRVGGDATSAEALLRRHEALELRCRVAYARYAELMRCVESVCTTAFAKDDLLSRRDLMDSACRRFALRIERRRNALVTSVRFHRLVGEYFERTGQVYERLLMGVNGVSLERDVKNATEQLRILRTHQSELELLQRALRRAGERLCCSSAVPSVLNTIPGSLPAPSPVQSASVSNSNASCCDCDVARVRGALDAAIARGSLFADGLELRLLTLQQAQHVGQYETDARRACQWLADLLRTVRHEYAAIGCTEQEIRLQRDRQGLLQKTAESIYNYGRQLLDAASCLRMSCRLSCADNSALCEHLEQAWSKLRMTCEEQMTRLRVCAVFHRSTTQQCRRLEILINNSDLDQEQQEQPEQEREQLLQDVGRMVRLGRLLRTRLKDAILIEDEMSNPSEQPNASAIEAISRKLSEVTNLAEQLDAALRTVHDTHNENATRSQSSDEQCTEDARSESEEFVTASECTCTPQSRSSSYHTASECGTSPWLDQELDVEPLTSPTQQQVSSKLIREITEIRTFKVKQCQVASSASLVRTCQEFKERQEDLEGLRDEVSDDVPDYAWGKYYHSYIGKQAIKGCL